MSNYFKIFSMLIVAALSLGGCSVGYQGDAAEISRIEAKCGLKKGSMRIDAKFGFTFNPDPKEKFETVDCALSEIRSSSLSRHIKYGFVGNEQPSPKKTNN